jgi:ubiquinone/menaquinone biosynthesis C-methylase UbiE
MNILPSAIHAAPADDRWEAAYIRFETPEQEIQKFLRRLRLLGVPSLARDSQIVELFCGRGNGLHALSRLGFRHLEGADLSARLVGLYKGPAQCYVCDCRQLPFRNQSKDVLIVHGGLHHLPTLPESLEQALNEAYRVLRKEGRMIVVEPWRTPFLTAAHWISEIPIVRRCSARLDAFATMTELERQTYEQWLSQPQLVLNLLHRYFTPVHESFARGKCRFVGVPL